MKTRIMRGLATGAALALVLAALAPVARAAAPMNVRIGTQLWPGALPIYTAIAAGLTKKNGLNVDKIIVSSGGHRRAALLAGEIDFAEFAFSNVAVAASKGAPIKYVMATHDYETFSLIVRSALKDKVHSIADLKGRVMGFTTPGAGAWAWARIFLLKSGLKPQVDVSMVGGMSKTPVVLAALKTGRIDAHPSWEPITTMALRSGIAFPLVKIWEPAAQEKWVGKSSLGSGLSTTLDVIKHKPELVRRMVAAVKGGIAYINDHDPATIANLLATNAKTKEYWGAIDHGVLVDMIEKSSACFRATDGRISRSGFDNEMHAILEGGILKKPVAFDKMVDTSFVGTKP